MSKIVITSAAALLLAGCASTIESQQIKGSPQPGTAVNGVPFRIRDRVTLELYKKTEKGYELVNRQLETMTDPSKLYVLNFSGQMLADTSVKFEQHADGSLSTVKLGDGSQAPEAVTAVATGLDTLVATDKAIRDAAKAKKDAAEAEAEAEAAETLANAEAAIASSQSAVELAYAARVLEQKLAELSAEAKPSERLALQGQIELAKMKARAAAAKAGMDDPFPE
jgi:hypothetical protein